MNDGKVSEWMDEAETVKVQLPPERVIGLESLSDMTRAFWSLPLPAAALVEHKREVDELAVYDHEYPPCTD